MTFYVVNNDLFDDSSFAFGEKYENANFGPALVCEVCGNYLSMMKWLPPFDIKVSRKSIGDFVFGTFVNFIVSSRFKTVFEREGLKGIQSFEPVTVYFQGEPLDEWYFYPNIVMSDFRIDLKRSGFEFENVNTCPACQKGGSIIRKYDRIIFERPEEIDLDIFNTKVLGETPFVSQRFKDLVEKHRLTNISMIESSLYKQEALS